MKEFASAIVLSVLLICLTAMIVRGCDENHEAEMKCMERGEGHFYLNGRCWDKETK